MNVTKSYWVADEGRVQLSLPLTKVDRENRLVTGFASLDNVDSHDDVVLSEASAKAFARFRGNIREMHQPIAAGHMVDFYEDEVYDPQTQKFYRGIVVTAYVSKGAESTWEKVIDGTLTGFSIGGKILDASNEFVKDANKTVRFIKDYELIELSLVDSPANRLANIQYVTKVFSLEHDNEGHTVVKGLMADIKSETVYYCPQDEVAKASTEPALNCPNCGNSMVEIGVSEYSDDADRTSKFSAVVSKYLASNGNTQDEPAQTEGGVDVAKDTENKVAEEEVAAPELETDAVEQGQAESEVDSSVEAQADVQEVETPTEVSEAADVSEVDSVENDIEKMINGLKSDIEKQLEKNAESLESVVKSATAALPELQNQVSEVEKKLGELEDRYNGLTEKFNGVTKQLEEVEKTVKVVEGATAVKKSGDLGGSSEKVEKSSTGWGGHFLGVNHLTND